MEGGDGHAREGGEQRQQQRPPWPGPVLRLTRASQKQPPQPARYVEWPVRQPHAQEREVRAQLETLITIITKNASNGQQFSQKACGQPLQLLPTRIAVTGVCCFSSLF